MQWSDIPRNPSTRMLRQFAGLWLVFFGSLAAWHGLVKERLELGVSLAVLALVVGILGLAYPRAVRWIFVGWMLAVFPIGWAVSRVVLAALFYGCFTPLALVFRLWGRDALELRRRANEDTYWQPKPAVTDATRYFQQF